MVSVYALACTAVLVTSTLVVALLTPVSIWTGKRLGLVDVPGGRRTHLGRVPRTGGLGLYPAFAATLIVSLTFPIPRTDPLEAIRLTGILLGMGIVWCVGLMDDWLGLSPWLQLGGLLVAALVAVRFKVFIEVFNSPLGDRQVWVDWYAMLPITLVWIAGLSGTVNMLDGLDGLATGVTAISALVLFVHMLRLGQLSVSLLPLALLGCCIGFLPYNLSPARIFLGGGAYLLGYALATLSIVAGAKVASLLLTLWLPIVDVLWQVYTRRRRGQAIGLGDRGHLHFRLQDRGWDQKQIVLAYYGVTLVLGGVALLASSRLLKLSVLTIAAVLMAAALATLARNGEDKTATGR